MKRLEHKHPLAIRWFHWINFPVLAIMIWSGILIYWASADVVTYRIGLGHTTLVRFFPGWFFTKFHFDSRLSEGLYWHFFFMWFFAINGIAYVMYTALSGEWRSLVPNAGSWLEAIQVVLYDLHLSKIHPPRRKFNGAQQISYTLIIVMGAFSLLTGLAIFKTVQFGWLTTLLGGYKMARFEHFWLTMGYVAFFLVHVAQVIKAGWNNFRAMITGYEVVRVEESHS
ncbi:MAG TPA: cytochrome b/b6 domain-containing protein [Armatimonadota bacterium]|nr:cytochrome b/b6 domain-containing protein [Armatimonadota bacterium]